MIYKDILTGNADSFDYETTVVQSKKKDTAIRDLITEDIQSELEDNNIEYETLDDDEVSDVVIIVGTDFR